MKINELELFANQIRFDIVEMIYRAGTGHPAGSLGLADLFAYIYFKEAKVFPRKSDSKLRDFIFVSNGHVAPVLYSSLARRGFFKTSELKNLRKLGSRLQGHPHYESGIGENKRVMKGGGGKQKVSLHPDFLFGVENSGGPLGQGISQAVGLASSLKRDSKQNRVFCFTGDGELEEGQCWEAFLFAAKEKLDNLCIIVDKNDIQIDGSTNDVGGLVDLHKKLSSFGLFVIEFDGNDMIQIGYAFKHAKEVVGKPICLLANTISGKGVSFMEGDYKWHGRGLKDKEYREAKSDLLKEKLKLKLVEKNKK